jgi:uncharacterized membrane protein YgdD (TMEM256/DUF423 family)
MKKNASFPTLTTAAVVGASAVLLGALGAHALKKVLDPQALASFETAVRYQMFHAVALLATYHRHHGWWSKALWTGGTLLFSGSIYGLTLLPLLGIEPSFLGPVTPLGGILLVTGWIWLLVERKNALNGNSAT